MMVDLSSNHYSDNAAIGIANFDHSTLTEIPPLLCDGANALPQVLTSEELKIGNITSKENAENYRPSPSETIDASPTVSLATMTKIGPKRTVRFGDVLLHVHPIILGAPPAIPISGVPITIAWHKMLTKQFTVDEFEEKRGPGRNLQKLKIPSVIREDWLKAAGYSRAEIHYAKMKSSHSEDLQELFVL